MVEPVFPATCTVLAAQLQQSGSDLPSSAENSFDTARIQAAMNACPAGKAVELAPSGANNAFLIAPIQLVSGVTLIVDAGVTVFGSRNARDYDVTSGSCGIIDTSGQGCNALIQGNSVVNAGVMGYGTIDGRGGDTIIGQSTTWWGLANTADGQGKNQNNPRMFQVNSSNNFTLYKITLKNSPKFHVSYSLGKGFTAWGVKIITPTLARNTDGIDPASAQNITIANSYIADGDDMIAVKSSGGQQAQNITIRDSHFGSGHGISIGSETNSGVSNMRVTNVSINMDATNTSQNGIRIKGDSSRGGLVTNVTYDGVCMQNATHPLVFNPYYSSATGSLIPFYTNITLRNFHSLTTGSMTFEGYSPTYPFGLTLDNVQIDGVKASNLTASYANITLGPGAVNFTPTGTGVNITNNIVTPPAIRDCSTAFPLAAGELFPSVGSSITGSTIPVTVQILPITSGAPAPTGTVYIMEGANIVASATVAGVLTPTQVLSASAGTHTYTAAYQGDGTYPAFTFGSYIATVGSPSLTSSTALTTSANQIAFQADVVLTARVSTTAGTLSGNVTFVDGASTQLGTVAIDNTGTASFATNSLTSGNHSITAVFAGDANHQGSTSNAVVINVSASTAVPVTVNSAVTSPTGTPTFGQTVVVKATLAPQTVTSAPGGTVTFTLDGVVQPAVAVAASSASLTLTGLSTGNHTLLSAYSGDSVYASSSAPSLAIAVAPEPTSTTLGTSTASTLRFQPVTLTATVDSPSVDANGVSLLGNVSFYSGSTLIATAALNGANVATYTTSTLPPGANSISAVYNGTANEGTSTSATATVTVSSTTGNSPALPQLIPYSITSVAGTPGVASYGGDGAAATAATLNLPKGIVADASGNLYIADSTNLVVRKVLAATGVISTIAGGGSATCAGFTDSYGDGCAATSAPLYGPRGTALDATGNLYIADYTKSEVRKVTTSTGIISLYAGTGSGGYSGDGAAANQGAVHNPENLSFDAAGNLYIADTKNNAIRKVDTTGIITTIAGNGTASYSGDGAPALQSTLNTPNAVVVDPSGNIYIADSGNFVIRKIDTSGNISTYAGTGVAAFTGNSGVATQTGLKNPTAVAVDTAGNVYITDSGNNLVFRVDALTQNLTTVAGSSSAVCAGSTDAIGDGCPALSAKVSGTSAAAFDGAGNLYLADTNNNVIRRVANNTGFPLTAVGASQTQTLQVHFGPNDGPAAAPYQLSGGTGDFNVGTSPTCTVNADSTQDCLLQITFAPTAAGLRTSSLKISASLGGVQTFNISGVSNLPGAADSISILTTTPANGILVYGQTAGFTATVSPATGSQVPTGTVAFTVDGVTLAPTPMSGGAATYSTANLTAGSHSIAAMYSGDATYASASTASALTVSVAKGTTSTALTSSTPATMQAQSVTLTATVTAPGTITPQGTVNFLNGVNLLGTVTLNSGGVATLTLTTLPVGSDSITAVFTATTNYNASTSPAVAVTITIAPLPQLIPYALSTAAGIPGTSSYTGDGTLATAATIKAPQGLSIDAAGNLFISDSGNLAIRKVNAATGIISTYAGAGTLCAGPAGTDSAQGDGCPATQAVFTSPRGITLDPSTNLYIADPGKNFVRRVDNSSQIITTYAGTGSSGSAGDGGQSTLARVKSPQAIDSDTAGNLYLSDTSNNRVRIINPSGVISVVAGYPPQTSNTAATAGFGGDGQLATSSTVLLNGPTGAAVDPSGNLYIADRLNNRIRKVNAGKIISTFAGNSTAVLPIVAAGGPAASTPINSPYAVAADGLGNIYISDYGNNVVWRVDGSTQYMYLVAGNGTGSGCSNSYGDGCAGTQGKLSHPYQLAFDPQGNLYIADSGYSAIRKLSLGTQFATTQTGASLTQTLQAHFAANDTPAATGAYSVTGTGFTAGTATCTLASDNTTNCLLPVTFTPTTTGTLTATLKITSAGGYAQSFTLSGTAIPGGVPTTTTLAAVSPASGVILYGQTASIAATVVQTSGSGTPTGSIVFTVDGVAQTAVPLSAGSAPYTLTGLATGQHFITASYNGDLNDQSSATGAAGQLEIDVNPAPTSTTLSISSNNVPLGQSVTLTATVSVSTTGVPTGSVAFSNGSTVLGYGTLNASNTASYTTTALPAGNDSLTANYVGDSHFLSSTSTPLVIAVSPQNIWVVNANGTFSELSNSGTAVSSTGIAGGGSGIAIDNAGNIWSASATGNSLSKITSTGAAAGTFTGAGLSGATALAIEGSGYVWIANTNNSLSVFTNAGVAVSPTGGYTGGNLSTPSSIAIDTAGNVWVTNSGNASVTEFLGAADPIVTPLATAIKASTLGAKP